VTVAYLLFAQLVIWLNDPVSAGAGLWPGAGVTLAALLLLPTRSWGWVFAAVVVAELGGDLAHGYGVGASLGWTLGNVLEPLVGASLIRRFVHADGVLRPVRMLLIFLTFGVVVGPLVGATVGATTTALSFGMALPEVWPKYFIGDALGVLIGTPAVLALRTPPTGQSRGEAAALSVISLTVCAGVFSSWGGAWLATGIHFPWWYWTYARLDPVVAVLVLTRDVLVLAALVLVARLLTRMARDGAPARRYAASRSSR